MCTLFNIPVAADPPANNTSAILVGDTQNPYQEESLYTENATPDFDWNPLYASFLASNKSGVAPLTVRFLDISSGRPTGWMWDINGDGFRDYSDRNCEHTYTTPGFYTVTFSVTRDQEVNTTSRPNYIYVMAKDPDIQNFTLNIDPGWNLVSSPKTLKEGHWSVGDVFGGIDTGGHSIFCYDARSQSWRQMSSQESIQCFQGIWIYSTNSTQVPLVFNEDPSVSWCCALSPGWQTIGFTYMDPVSARDALLPVQNSWKQLIGFHGASQHYETSIINGRSGSHSDENLVYPGKGYWLYMTGYGFLES